MLKTLKKIKLNNIRFKIIEFLDRKKLFGVHKKCWGHLVLWSIGVIPWEEVPIATCGNCHYCCPEGYERDKVIK